MVSSGRPERERVVDGPRASVCLPRLTHRLVMVLLHVPMDGHLLTTDEIDETWMTEIANKLLDEFSVRHVGARGTLSRACGWRRNTLPMCRTRVRLGVCGCVLQCAGRV